MKLGGVYLSLLLTRKGLRFKLFEEKFYELTQMKALPMVQKALYLSLHIENKGVRFFQLNSYTKFKPWIY